MFYLGGFRRRKTISLASVKRRVWAPWQSVPKGWVRNPWIPHAVCCWLRLWLKTFTDQLIYNRKNCFMSAFWMKIDIFHASFPRVQFCSKKINLLPFVCVLKYSISCWFLNFCLEIYYLWSQYQPPTCPYHKFVNNAWHENTGKWSPWCHLRIIFQASMYFSQRFSEHLIFISVFSGNAWRSVTGNTSSASHANAASGRLLK